MKTIALAQTHRNLPLARSARGFTLPEILTVVAIFAVLVGGMVTTQLFGMRMYSISQNRLILTSNARNVMNRVRDEVRASQIIWVGSADASGFTTIADNTPRAGNALKICADASNTNQYVYYFMDAAHSCLKRVTSDSNQVETIANNITNQIVFQAEDCQGNVVVNDQNNEVVRINLNFQQWECPSAVSTNGSLYGYYQLQTRVSPRVY
jgi:prepilin-type N-terminal cleavage/methylation domain-containing protein